MSRVSTSKYLLVLSLLLALLLSGCGGGRGKNTEGTVTFKSRESQVYIAYNEDDGIYGYGVIVDISVKKNKNFYVGLEIEGNGLSKEITLNTDGTVVSFTVRGESGLTPGKYKGNLMLVACDDPDCNKVLEKSEYYIPYTVEIRPILKVYPEKINMSVSILNQSSTLVKIQLPAGQTEFQVESTSPKSWIKIFNKTSTSFELTPATIPQGIYTDRLKIVSGEKYAFIDVNVQVTPNELLTAEPPLKLFSGAYDWYDFQGDSNHLGYVPIDIDPTKFTVRWRWPSDSTRADVIEPRVYDGKVYMTLNQIVASYLLSINEANGSLDWLQLLVRNERGFSKVDSPYITPNEILVRSRRVDEDMLSFSNTQSGDLIRTKSLQSPSFFHVENSYLYLLDRLNAIFVKSNLTTNENIWSVVPEILGESRPIIQGDNIYFFIAGYLSKYEKNTGQYISKLEIWPPVSSYFDCTVPLVLDDHSLLVLSGKAEFDSDKMNVVSVNTNTMEKNWSVNGSYISEPVTNGNEFYIFNRNPFQLEARSVKDGQLMWVWVPESEFETQFYGNMLLTNNFLFFSTDMLTHAVDLEKHKTMWVFPGASTSILMSKNGLLMISTAESPASNYLVTINTH